ncbi:MAG: sigma-54-dependent transcriptional regulator [Planctomycetota bacterium]
MTKPKILILEDDTNAGPALKSLLEREGLEVQLERDGEAGLRTALEHPFDLVISDIVMPRMDGMEVFRQLSRNRPEIPVIIMTAHGSIQMAVEAMREGAADFLEKPLDIQRVRLQVKKALERSGLERENRQLRRRIDEAFGLDRILGEDREMRTLAQKVRQVAPTDATVLILGESGTGKELVANALHELSNRKAKPFVKINCAALPEELLQSELFGHVKGAFTGALATRQGRFEEADGGTLFLDEIGDLPPSMQVKLLRFLQDGTFERVGDSRTLRSNLRLITATHVDLQKALQEGRMREDFYYRIKGITLSIPPLRNRPGDIPLLLRHFLKEAGRPDLTISPEALKILQAHAWPGNVRQLRSVCQTITVFCQGPEIGIRDLPGELLQPLPKRPTALLAGDIPLMSLDAAETILIQKALDTTGGNKTEAARLLGIGLRTLYRKLEGNPAAAQPKSP